jgi:hypothetical protein
MAKKESNAPADKVAFYEALVATYPEAERKGAGTPYTSLNGNMYSYMPGSGILALRLPPGVREEFLTKFETQLYEAYGIVQKEYVAVPDHVLPNTEQLKPYFAASHDYAKSLKPKPSKRKA